MNSWHNVHDEEPPVGKLVAIKTEKGEKTSWMRADRTWAENENPQQWRFLEKEDPKQKHSKPKQTNCIPGDVSILQEAAEIRGGNRQSDYGDAVQNFTRIAAMASLMTGKNLTAADCAAVQIAVKLCREAFHHKRDNLVDLCGYADILNLIREEDKE